MWGQYIWQRQTCADLSQKYHRSRRWVRRKLDEVKIKNVVKLTPQTVVVVADVTFFSQTNGLAVFREPNLKKNIWWQFTEHERVGVYEQGRTCLEQNGFEIKAVVLDGKTGVRRVFADIPVQMCHFHQKQIIHRYLTNRPKMPAGVELKGIARVLSRTDEQTFSKLLNWWHDKWQNFLKEKTTKPEIGRWNYTHKRLRSAYRSLKTNLPYLFTYQRYPDLNIPNTTNSLDGFFNSLKSKLNVHRGMNRSRFQQATIELLKGVKQPHRFVH